MADDPLVSLAAASRLTAAEFNEAQNVFGVIKQANQSVTSSTVLQNDNELVIPSTVLVLSAQYQFWCFIDYEGGTQGSSDFQWEWSLPAGAAIRYAALYLGTGGGLTFSTQVGSANLVAGTNGAGFLRGVTMTGTLVMSTTAGAMQFEWAQNTSSGTATIVHAQSSLVLARML